MVETLIKLCCGQQFVLCWGKVGRLVSEYLRIQMKSNPHTHSSSAFEAQRTVLALHLALPNTATISQFNKGMGKI
jgi:hypothetical protein